MLLENILREKEKRIRKKSSIDFYTQTLLWNSFNVLRRNNKERKQRRVLKRQADLFRQEMLKRRQYFRLQRQDAYDSHPRHNGEAELTDRTAWDLMSMAYAGWSHATRKAKVLRFVVGANNEISAIVSEIKETKFPGLNTSSHGCTPSVSEDSR